MKTETYIIEKFLKVCLKVRVKTKFNINKTIRPRFLTSSISELRKDSLKFIKNVDRAPGLIHLRQVHLQPKVRSFKGGYIFERDIKTIFTLCQIIVVTPPISQNKNCNSWVHRYNINFFERISFYVKTVKWSLSDIKNFNSNLEGYGYTTCHILNQLDKHRLIKTHID